MLVRSGGKRDILEMFSWNPFNILSYQGSVIVQILLEDLLIELELCNNIPLSKYQRTCPHPKYNYLNIVELIILLILALVTPLVYQVRVCIMCAMLVAMCNACNVSCLHSF